MVPTILNEKTLVPISILVMLSGLIYWGTGIGHIATRNESELEKLKSRSEYVDERTQRELRIIQEKAHSIDIRLSRIEALLKDLREEKN